MMAAAGRHTLKLRAPENVRELVRSAHPHIKRKLRAALEHIQLEPEAGELLRDEVLGLRSYRLGRLRIIYRVAKPGVIDIVAIGPRKTIYEETFRLVKRQIGE
jgi:mRNA-degrading endonuclease RelE of RelBE toxin-antitoxin system